MDQRLIELKSQLRNELTLNILPFWMDRMTDMQRGGFHGRIDGYNNLHADAPKGAVLNARILWTFASAYRVIGDPQYLDTAMRAKRYLIEHFYDAENGGIYWMLNADGTPLDTKKQIYALGFAIYGFSELGRATGDRESIEYAIKLYEDIEAHAYDSAAGGYWEAFTREWGEIADARLSEKETNDRKTMNTHLHILEPYTNLYRVWQDPGLKKKIQELLDVFMDRIYRSDIGHLGLFFGDAWELHGDIRSYGHDIEASWLMTEAAQVIGDTERMQRLLDIVRRIADVCSSEALQPDGSMIYEYDPSTGHIEQNRDWWPQAETVIGYFNSWQLLGREEDLARCIGAWHFIQEHIIDHVGGEWYWGMLADGQTNFKDDKAGPWKCPYHNSRMCLELIERISG
ncbi:MAG: AGE family epimerase/isomerase [Bacteroidaceae bacterium]|nr:AGE family epimerase/isomerase [Bacteroidaceae bacterium]